MNAVWQLSEKAKAVIKSKREKRLFTEKRSFTEQHGGASIRVEGACQLIRKVPFLSRASNDKEKSIEMCS